MPTAPGALRIPPPASTRWLRVVRISTLLSFLLLILVGSWEGEWEHPEMLVFTFVWIYGAILLALFRKNLQTGLGLAIGTGLSLLACGVIVLVARVYELLSPPPAQSRSELLGLLVVSVLFVLTQAALAGGAVKTCRALGWKVRETRRVAEGCILSFIFFVINAQLI